MTASAEFASLLCSRLCHDLLSPVGALNNGLELLADERDPAMREQVLTLLGDSARATANKLKFFRLAFGAAGGFGERIDAREAKEALEGLLAEGKREIGWMVEEPALPKAAAKVLLNLAAIAGEALVRGGRLDIGAETGESGALEIVVRAEGPRLALDERIRAVLTGEEAADAITSRTAAAHLVRALLAEADGTLQVDQPGPGTLLFGVAFRRTG